MSFFTLRLVDGGLELLDQRVLPGEERVLLLDNAEDVAEAIENLVVRGAPAIGVTAAMGLAVELRRARLRELAGADLYNCFTLASERLRRTRPTAVNLDWALDRMQLELKPLFDRDASAAEIVACAESLAQRMHDEDIDICRAIGDAGAPLVPSGARLLTHCNAGALATAGYGTALGVVRSSARDGRLLQVLASETRPFFQGARLTAWELSQDKIPVTVVTDSMCGSLMSRGEIDLVVVGADRIAANGDVANKVGTYSLAILARAHDIPFYVAAPLSTIDPATPSGAEIPIEERAMDEVTRIGDLQIAPEGVPAMHPAFDVTPAELVSAIVTEKDVVRAPFGPSIAALLDA